ncbi:MAG: type IV pilin N-terminal domain-containing protein [Methanoregulaceae archaeon]|jgi:hypothetical protein
MSCKKGRDDAVSGLVGEMLMLTLVLILMAVFAATASNYLPPPRDPSVTILQEVNDMAIILHHRGGDAVPGSGLLVTVEGTRRDFSLVPYGHMAGTTDPDILFDLGGRITFSRPPSGSTIKVSTARAVLYTGVVP